ncbi:MAG: hypothetical protein D6685_04235 [Bacteroidetes bacterium]|nr:hypothetical protein AWN76_002935 [Rhodothermaceae bacterium RA]RMH67055.1 MAG: hypothetical protein D6685_04235 [Bacteroidota bacterium]
MKADPSIEQQYRRFLLITAGFVFAATPVELVLTEHVESTLQWVPFFLCGAGLVAVVAALRAPGRGVLLGLRAVMGIIALGGLFGTYEHLAHNVAFERDIRPAAGFGEVLWEGLFGASPLLAPGILILGALLAAAATYRHPALRRDTRPVG